MALNLQQTTTIAHHPIIAERTPRFQAEDLFQPWPTRSRTMKVFVRGCQPAVALVVLRQVGLHQKLIGCLITADVLTPQLLDQSILMRAMIAFHSAFGLWRTGGDDANAQLGAHASKLRQWRPPCLFLRFGRWPHIDILPVRVQSLRNAVLLDPASEQVGRRPSRFLLPQVAQDGAGGVVHQIHQTSFWTASLEPSMKTSIQLHQLAEMCLALAPLAIRSALALPPQYPPRKHPTSQCPGTVLQAIFAGQVFGGQRRTKPFVDPAAVLVSHQPQHSFAKSLRLGTITAPASSTVLQPFDPLLLIPLPKPLCLASTDPKPLCSAY